MEVSSFTSNRHIKEYYCQHNLVVFNMVTGIQTSFSLLRVEPGLNLLITSYFLLHLYF